RATAWRRRADTLALMRRPSPLLLQSVAAPAAVLVLSLLLWALAGAGWGLVLLGLGWGALLAFRLVHLDRLTSWAEAPLDAPVPEGSGVWRGAFSALYRRVRTRRAHERDLAHTIERFQSAAEAIPD